MAPLPPSPAGLKESLDERLEDFIDANIEEEPPVWVSSDDASTPWASSDDDEPAVSNATNNESSYAMNDNNGRGDDGRPVQREFHLPNRGVARFFRLSIWVCVIVILLKLLPASLFRDGERRDASEKSRAGGLVFPDGVQLPMLPTDPAAPHPQSMTVNATWDLRSHLYRHRRDIGLTDQLNTLEKNEFFVVSEDTKKTLSTISTVRCEDFSMALLKVYNGLWRVSELSPLSRGRWLKQALEMTEGAIMELLHPSCHRGRCDENSTDSVNDPYEHKLLELLAQKQYFEKELLFVESSDCAGLSMPCSIGDVLSAGLQDVILAIENCSRLRRLGRSTLDGIIDLKYQVAAANSASHRFMQQNGMGSFVNVGEGSQWYQDKIDELFQDAVTYIGIFF